MIYYFIFIIFVLSIIYHFNPRFKNGFLIYNDNGRYNKTTKKLDMEDFFKKLLSCFAILVVSIVFIYTSGIFITYTAMKDKNNDLFLTGFVLSVFNSAAIFITLNLLPL